MTYLPFIKETCEKHLQGKKIEHFGVGNKQLILCVPFHNKGPRMYQGKKKGSKVYFFYIFNEGTIIHLLFLFSMGNMRSILVKVVVQHYTSIISSHFVLLHFLSHLCIKLPPHILSFFPFIYVILQSRLVSA